MIVVNTTQHTSKENEKVKPVMERKLIFHALSKERTLFFNLVYSVSTFHVVNLLPTSMLIIFYKISLLVNWCFFTALITTLTRDPPGMH